MHVVGPEAELVPLRRRETEELHRLWAYISEAEVLSVGGPWHHVRALHQLPEAALAAAQGLLRLLALGDVEHGAHQPHSAAERIAHHFRTRVHMAHQAFGQTNTMIDQKRAPASERVFGCSVEARKVFGIHELQPARMRRA